MLDFDVRYGDGKEPDWRAKDDGLDDDEELDVTPASVIAMLGFDPRELTS